MDVGNYSPISFDLPTAAGDDSFEPFECLAAQDEQPHQTFYESPLSIRDWPGSSPVSNEPIIDKVVMRIAPNVHNGFGLHHGDMHGPIQFRGSPMIDKVVMQIHPRPHCQQREQSVEYVFNNSFGPGREWPSPASTINPLVGEQMTVAADLQPAFQAAGEKRRSYCPTCGMSYGRREDMLRHLRAHSKNSKFCCGFCPKSFRRREVWREHQDWCRNRSRASMPKRGRMARCIACAERDVDCSLGTPCFNCATLGEECTRRFGNRSGENTSSSGQSWPASPDDTFPAHEQASFPTSVLWSPPAESSRGQPQSKIQNLLFQNYTRRFESPMRWWITRLSSLPHADSTDSGFSEGHSPSGQESKPLPSLMEMAQQLDSDLMSWHQESAWKVLKTAIAAFGSQGVDPRSDRWEAKYGYSNACRPEFWAKAKAAIENSPDILSFQVILANFILGMIHSPTPEYDESFAAEAPSGISFPRQDSRKVGNRFIRRGISDLFQLIRQVRDLPASGVAATAVGQHYLKSFFSLGLVLDTISSAVDSRPVLIHDEDCAIILDEQTQGPPAEQPSGLWQLSRLQIKQVKVVKTTDGRQLIDCHSRLGEEGAPITILLYRKVTQLQALLFRRRPQSELEAAILEAIDVYHHGNKRYGGWSSDPLSICDSSCTINLGIRWHLACLLLAAVIERIELVMKPSALSEKLRTTLWSMRMKAVFILSGLANLSTAGPEAEQSTILVAEKVAEAFLDDPWIQVLVSAMVQALKVSETWRKDGYTIRTPHETDALSPSEISCLDCLKRLGSPRPCE